jgi:phosphatidate cytidylyltransferase
VAKSNLAVRLSTAGVVAPMLLLTLFLGPADAWYGIVFVATLLASWELFGMTHPEDPIARAIGAAQAGALSLVVYFAGTDSRHVFTAITFSVILGALIPLWRLGEIRTAAVRVLAGIGGPVYVGMLLVTLALIRRDSGDAGPGYVLMTLMFAWLGDTGGYFMGRAYGRTKLYEAVSPKKTREGFAGSLLGSCAGALLAHFWYLPSIPLGHALALALFTGSLGQLGDLVESLLKRSTGVKDSGALVPGHGGILDRIDALLIVSPIVYAYVHFGGG